MSTTEAILSRIVGERGRAEVQPIWHRELHAQAPAVGSAWLGLQRIMFDYKECESVTEDESDFVELFLQEQLENVLRHAVSLRKYTRVDGARATWTIGHPFQVIKGRKGYQCRLGYIEYVCRWQVAPSQTEWDERHTK